MDMEFKDVIEGWFREMYQWEPEIYVRFAMGHGNLPPVNWGIDGFKAWESNGTCHYFGKDAQGDWWIGGTNIPTVYGWDVDILLAKAIAAAA